MNFNIPFHSRLSFQRIYIGAALALTVLFFVIFLGYIGMSENQKSTGWVNHTLLAINKIQNVETELNSLGTSSRGFVITSQDRYLGHFLKTLNKYSNAMSEVKSLIEDNPDQIKRIYQIEYLSNELISFHKANIQRVKNHQTKETIKLIKKGIGQDKVDSIRKIIIEMIKEEESLLQERLEKQKKYSNRSDRFILLGSTTAFLIVCISTFMVLSEFKRRTITQRILNETAQVQKAILEASAFALIAADLNGKITLFNPAAEKLLGYTSEEMIGKMPALFHLPEEMIEMSHQLKSRF